MKTSFLVPVICAALSAPALTAQTAEKPAAAPAKSTTRSAADAATKKAAPKAGEAPEADTSAQAAKAAASLTDTQRRKLLDLINKGDEAALGSIPGVGAIRAAAIRKSRPFKKVEDVVAVDGIGESTFDEIVKWARAGMPGSAPEPPATTRKAADAPKPTGTAPKKN